MIHYSIMPAEVVYDDSDGVTPMIKGINMGGLYLEVIDRGRVVEIVRLISTSPGHFMNPNFQPGRLVAYDDLKRGRF